MGLTESQSKFVELMLKLDLRTREYKKLCEELEVLKKSVKNPNDKQFAMLLARFEENKKELENINAQLSKLKAN
ncbi:MAG: hypothetical protein J6T39_01845 [Clostridia bacterium]|nr:hypothetical protein [Clostridia bacterium]